MCIHMYTYRHTHINIYIYIYNQVCVYIYICIYTCAYTYSEIEMLWSRQMYSPWISPGWLVRGQLFLHVEKRVGLKGP